MITAPRKPVVAGQFYPSSKKDLLEIIDNSFLHPLGPGKKPPSSGIAPDAIITPHAGFMYSAPIAAHSYFAISSVREFDRIVIVGPNHRGLGEDVSVPISTRWMTPLGDVRIDIEAAAELSALSFISRDDLSHQEEHSIEVQLPFIQHLYGSDMKLLPIGMLRQDRNTALELGEAITRLRGKSVIIASSDLTHYERQDDAFRRDRMLIKEIEALEVDGFYRTLNDEMITACGYGPIATVMTFCRVIGSKRGNLLKYASSGDTGGSKDSVVGYAAISFN